jgi:hypothetical protein
MSFSLTDSGAGFARSGAGEIQQMASNGFPWLYLFDVYGGSPNDPQGTQQADYDLLWLDRGRIVGGTSVWMLRQRRGMYESRIGFELPFDLSKAKLVSTVQKKVSGSYYDSESLAFTFALGGPTGLARFSVGNPHESSQSPFTTNILWYPKEIMDSLEVRVVGGVTTTVIPPGDLPGQKLFSLWRLSDQMAGAK